MIEFSKLTELLPTSNARTLGSAAIDAAYDCANRGLELGVANEDLDLAAKLVSAGVPDPRYTNRLKLFARRISNREYSGADDQTRIRLWLEENRVLNLSLAPTRLNALIQGLEWDYDESIEEKRQAIDKVRKVLRSYSPVHQNQIDELWSSGELDTPALLKRAKTTSEEEAGKELQWVEWIATYADDQTLLHVLEWGLHKVAQETSTPEFMAKVERVKQGYVKGLYAAHEDGVLDDLDGALSKLGQIRIATFHPLSQVRADSTIRGLAHKQDAYVEIRDTAADFDAYHELSHALFETVSPLLEEGTVEMIAGYIYENATSTAKPTTFYDNHDVKAAKELLALAGISEREWMRTFMNSKESATEKLIGLADAIYSKTGYDIAMYLEAAFSRIRDKYFEQYGATAQIASCHLAFEDISLFKRIFEGHDGDPKKLLSKVQQAYYAGDLTEDEVTKVVYLITQHQDSSA